MEQNWTQTAPPSRTGEYYQDGRVAPVGPQVGEYYQDGRVTPARVGALPTLEELSAKAAAPLPRLLFSGALAIGGLLMAVSEINRGPKGHHGPLGRYGRMAVGAGAAYWGFLYVTEAIEQMRPPAPPTSPAP